MIRQRLTRKLRNVLFNRVVTQPPTEDEPRAWLGADRSRYDTPGTFDFERFQVAGPRGQGEAGVPMSGAAAVLVVLIGLFPDEAVAHLVSTRFGELYSGMLHPATTLQHLLPWLALGLLGGLQGASAARWALIAFPLSVVAGLAVAAVVPDLALVDAFNIATLVVLGLLVALNVKFSAGVFVALVVLVGLSHGYANAASGVRGYEWLLYATGVGLMAYLLITLVSAAVIALARSQSWGRIAVRAAGSWIAAAGVMYSGFLLMLA
jgi:hydrogenase/urease accessory protein HupE